MAKNGQKGFEKIAIEVIFLTAMSEAEDCFYAWSPQLRCVRDGATREEALETCREALEILFESLIERSTLREFLEQHGYVVDERSDDGVSCYVLEDGVLFEPNTLSSLPQPLNPPTMQKQTLTPTSRPPIKEAVSV